MGTDYPDDAEVHAALSEAEARGIDGIVEFWHTGTERDRRDLLTCVAALRLQRAREARKAADEKARRREKGIHLVPPILGLND